MKNIVELLDREMRWHKSHKGISKKGDEWEAGFIKGLEYSKDFVQRMIDFKERGSRLELEKLAKALKCISVEQPDIMLKG